MTIREAASQDARELGIEPPLRQYFRKSLPQAARRVAGQG